ncbi:hypothetical protein F5Y18DRAFT_373921 [Xylariaceae sp. FL1019]|nr:hypothetical protein F5Y18DRAFT_373921 [Xylariaceae sp. FL1019]
MSAMAPLSYKSIVSSKPFTILVGPEKKACTIHSALLAALSRPLDVLVNGGMKEATEATAEWPDVDEETFAQVCQFAYTGDYDSPYDKLVPVRTSEKSTSSVLQEPTRSNHSFIGGGLSTRNPPTGGGLFGVSNASNTSSPNSSSLFGSSAPSNGTLDTSSSKAKPTGLFGSGGIGEKTPQGDETSSSASESLEKTYTSALLGHAKMYVFADCYFVNDLASLSVKKLGAVLSRVPTDQTAAKALAELAEFSYSNTIDRKLFVDSLRLLVSGHIAKHIKTLWPSPNIQSVLESYGELSKDVIGKMVPRLGLNSVERSVFG